jgi:cellulose biosynthesis protein BcsQ
VVLPVDYIESPVVRLKDGSVVQVTLENFEQVKDNFEFIIIDCPPSLSLLTINALVACQSVIVPLQCEYYSLEGLGRLLRTIKLVKERLNPDLRIEGILLTMFDRRNNLSWQVTEEVKKQLSRENGELLAKIENLIYIPLFKCHDHNLRLGVDAHGRAPGPSPAGGIN